MNYTKGLKKKGFKISYDRVAVTRDGHALLCEYYGVEELLEM